MYCKNCGKETNNVNHLCDECTQGEETSTIKEETKKVIPGKGMGITSFVFGILSIVEANLIFAIVAMVLGKKSRGTEGQDWGETGKKLAIVGFVVGGIILTIFLLISIIYVLFFVLFYVFQI